MAGFEPDVQLYRNMAEAAAEELSGIMEVSLEQRAKDLVKGALGRGARVKDPMFWPAGMLMLGLAEARKILIRDIDAYETLDRIDKALEAHISLWKRQYGSKVSFVDDALAGAALLEMYDQTDNELYKEAADRIYEFVLAAPRDAAGSIIYNASKGNKNIFADGVGQTSMFLSLYGRMFEKDEAIELARTQLLNFKKYGMDDRSGLCYHGYELKEDSSSAHNAGEKPDGFMAEKKGILGWGRAEGWLMMGLSTHASDDKDSELLAWYRERCATVASYCKNSGGFSWQIQAVDGHFDSSATGMLAYSIPYEKEAVRGSLQALAANTFADGRVGSALSSCEDFGVHYQNYGHYPWGQGAALAAMSRI